jgi:hypothetical protein
MNMYDDFIWYLSSDNVALLIAYILDEQYLAYQEDLLQGLILAIDIAAMIFPASKAVRAAALITLIASGVNMTLNAFAFREHYSSKIKSVANYNSSNPTNPYDNGVKCTLHVVIDPLDGPVYSYGVEPWYGGTMEGAAGQVGVWTANN